MDDKLEILNKLLNYNKKLYESIIKKYADEVLEILPIVINLITKVEHLVDKDIYEEYKEFLISYLSFCERCSDLLILEQNWDILQESQEVFIEFLEESIGNNLKTEKKCICCGQKVIFNSLPGYYSIIQETYGGKSHIAETINKDEYSCPYCGISDRGRLIIAFLEKLNIIYSKNEINFLHIAPERAIEDWILRNCPKVKYDSTDLYMDNVTFKSDVQNMNNISDKSYDFFICSHVLEHVQDDINALKELKRILKPNGLGIFLVPIALDIDEIDEEWGLSEEENWRRFGQGDHCRYYNKKGLLNRIRESGFYVHELGKDYFGEEIFIDCALSDTSTLYILSKENIDLQQLLNKNKVIDTELDSIPLISVIMSCYNHGRFVKDTIESVINQTYKNIEFLVADDGSTDNSVEILKQYSKYFDEEYYFDKNSGGKGLFLLEKANGKYVAVIHSDDVWEKDKLEKQVKILEHNSQYDACFTWNYYTDKDMNELEGNLFIQYNKNKSQWLYQFFMNSNCLCHPSLLIKKDIYLLIREGVEAFRQVPDFLMWIRLVQKSEIYIIPKVLTQMRRHRSESTTNMSAGTIENINRSNNDLMYIWYSEIKEMDNDCFIKSFKQSFMNTEAENDSEIACEKFFLLKNSNQHILQIASMLLYFDLYKNQAIRQCLQETYNFGRNDFTKFYANIGTYKLELQIHELLEINKRLEIENNELKYQLDLHNGVIL